MEKLNSPLLSWYIENHETIKNGNFMAHHSSGQKEELQANSKDASAISLPSVAPVTSRDKPKNAAAKPADKKQMKKISAASGHPMTGFWTKPFFTKKVNDEAIPILLRPMNLVRVGERFEYCFDTGKFFDGYKFDINPLENYDGGPLKFDSFKLFDNGPKDQPIISELKIENESGNLCISGVPQTVGHLKIDLFFSAPDSIRRTYRLAILYSQPSHKCLPTDPEAPFQVPDKFLKKIALSSSSTLLGVSIRGRDHENNGKFRDDCFDFTYNEEKQIGAVVVSDGAGSAEYSRKGAEIICQTFCNLIAEDIKADCFINLSDSSEESKLKIKDHLVCALHKTQEKLDECAAEHNIDYKTLYATMLAYVFAQTKSGIALISFAVGDGAIVGISENHVLELAELDHGKQLNETSFFTRDIFDDTSKFETRIKFFELKYPCTVLTMTDGVYNPWFWGHPSREHESVWLEKNQTISEFINNDQAIERLEEMLKIRVNGLNDDRTLVVFMGDVK